MGVGGGGGGGPSVCQCMLGITKTGYKKALKVWNTPCSTQKEFGIKKTF